ncbi:hypothetical protein HK104_001530, partial [Borealophlyctis nickersoniae]
MRQPPQPLPPAYLDEAYKPSSATIGQLSSILSTHGIPLPTSRARKIVYVDLFREKIAANRDKILREMRS